MASVNDRLGRLEARTNPPAELPEQYRWAMERHLRAVENWRRGMQGLEPLAEIRSEEEARMEAQALRDSLHSSYPVLRQDEGWQTEEAQTILDHWEREAERKLAKLEEGDYEV